MIVNNFDNKELETIMREDAQKGFYFAGIITRRAKDFPDHKLFDGNEDVIRFYSFDDYEDLMKHKESIINICHTVGARFYLYPRAISYKGVLYDLMKEMISGIQMGSEDIFINRVNTMLKFVRPYYGPNQNTYTLIDFDQKEKDISEFMRVTFGESLVLDQETVHGHHYLLKNVGFDNVKSTLEVGNIEADVKPDSALLIYF